MALTAEAAFKRGAQRILGRLAGIETVGAFERRTRDMRALAKKRPKVNPELSFNEAAGLLAVSTAQLEALLAKHPPKPPIFRTPGAKKRSTTLTELLDWADELKAKGAWKPLSQRGALPSAKLNSKLPFLVVKSPRSRQIIVEPIDPSLEFDARYEQALREYLSKQGFRLRVYSLVESFGIPWQDDAKRRIWVESFDAAIEKRAARLREEVVSLEKIRASARSANLEQSLAEAPARRAARPFPR